MFCLYFVTAKTSFCLLLLSFSSKLISPSQVSYCHSLFFPRNDSKQIAVCQWSVDSAEKCSSRSFWPTLLSPSPFFLLLSIAFHATEQYSNFFLLTHSDTTFYPFSCADNWQPSRLSACFPLISSPPGNASSAVLHSLGKATLPFDIPIF